MDVPHAASPRPSRDSKSSSGSILTAMGIAQFYFVRSPQGGLKRITARSVHAFHFDGGAFAPTLADGDGTVNVAALLVKTEDRCPVQLLDASFSRYRVLDDGRLDPAHRQVQALAMAH